ncbi:MAG: hypothetical protein CEN90_736 [Parcubacteria group bacterium Licking1014_17]|nr:MAG: hypothetical protein CEN90_736 [Parcubacteria group bacterium Licking1014_17]
MMSRARFKNIILPAVIVIFSFVLTIPSVNAAGLVPCGGSGEPLCGMCNLLQMGSDIIDYVVSIIVPSVAGLLFLAAGFFYLLSGANPGYLNRAKSLFWDTIYGVIIIYCSFMITNFILQTLTVDSNVSGSWFKIECSYSAGTSAASGGSSSGVMPIAPPTDRNIGGVSGVNARNNLAQAGVGINHPNECAEGQTTGCTSLTGIKDQTLAEVIDVKEGCPSCTVTVTGGTEAGHSDGHHYGYKVDVSSNTGVDNYIETSGNYTYIGERGGAHGGPKYKNNTTGAVWVLESAPPHWDVDIRGG